MMLRPVHTDEEPVAFNMLAHVCSLEMGFTVFSPFNRNPGPYEFSWLIMDDSDEEIIGITQFGIGGMSHTQPAIFLNGVYVIQKFRNSGTLNFIVDELIHEFNLDVNFMAPSEDFVKSYGKKILSLPRCHIR